MLAIIILTAIAAVWGTALAVQAAREEMSNPVNLSAKAAGR